MADITYQSVLDFENLIKQVICKQPSGMKIGIRDILNGVVYLLSLNNIKIKWTQLDKELGIVVRRNLDAKNHIYDIFRGAFSSGAYDTASPWELYFGYGPPRWECNLGQLSVVNNYLFEMGDWPKLKKIIEEETFPRLAYPEEIKKICIVTNEFVKAVH